MRRYGLWGIAAAVLAADRVTKALAGGIPPEGVTLIPGVVGLRYTENTGAAFSMLSGHPWLLGILSLAVIAAAGLYLRNRHPGQPAETGLMMMLGGAVGNMIDRFATGYVPDMIEFLFVRFAIFNVADMFLTVGCVLTAAGLLRKESGRNGKQEPDDGR